MNKWVLLSLFLLIMLFQYWYYEVIVINDFIESLLLVCIIAFCYNRIKKSIDRRNE